MAIEQHTRRDFPFHPQKEGFANRDAIHSHLVCVIPMFNESANAFRFLGELHSTVREQFNRVTLIVVDDGSSDSTGNEVCRAIKAGLPVNYLRLSRNFGKEIALAAGLEATERYNLSSDAVLIIDADFQHPFSTIRQMVDRWEQGIDMVYGVQVRRESGGILRRAFTWLFYRLLRSTSDRVTIPRDAGDFRLMDKRVVHAINCLPERNRYMKGLYAWVGFSSEGVPFEAHARTAGQSTFGFRHLSELALDGLTAFTSWPLRLASFAGGLISIAAFFYGIWIIFERLWIGQPIPGFATLAAAIMFFSGVQLISIGLLGEYLGRVFVEVKRRPLYIIADEINGPDRPSLLNEGPTSMATDD